MTSLVVDSEVSSPLSVSVETAAFALTDNHVFEAFLPFAFWIMLCVFSFFCCFLFIALAFLKKEAVFPGSMFRPLMYLYLVFL